VNSVRDDPSLEAVLRRLHAASDAQQAESAAYLAGDGARSTVGDTAEWEAGREFWRDKYVALDRDKAEFCYGLCRAKRARRVLEAGTSFGVSTLYLAAAVRDNGGGTVIATEIEVQKACVARQNFVEAGLAGLIDLREGDIREQIYTSDGPIEFLLLDIWVPMVRPILELVAPLMPTGAALVADNTAKRRTEYSQMFAFLADPANGFTTMTLPFDGGFELAIRTT
jgi:predicted O-methyltransferase YrrM